MIQHRLAIVVWLVLVLLAGRAVDGRAETLPRSVDQAITGDTRPYWTGRLEQDTMWRDTVYVGGDVTIAAAATLTLAPKTQVLFLPYRDDARSGLDTTRAELIVEGRLHAQAGGIVFRSANAGSLGADWYGLVVERGGRADVSNAAIRDGLRCLYAKMGGRVTMDAIAFANCGKPTSPADAAGLSMSQRRTQPLPALRHPAKDSWYVGLSAGIIPVLAPVPQELPDNMLLTGAGVSFRNGNYLNRHIEGNLSVGGKAAGVSSWISMSGTVHFYTIIPRTYFLLGLGVVWPRPIEKFNHYYGRYSNFVKRLGFARIGLAVTNPISKYFNARVEVNLTNVLYIMLLHGKPSLEAFVPTGLRICFERRIYPKEKGGRYGRRNQ